MILFWKARNTIHFLMPDGDEGKIAMRSIILALLAAAGLAITSPALTQAVAQYPFCIQGVDNPGWSGCSFNSFQECQAAAAGMEAECLSNPWYNAAAAVEQAPAGDSLGANGPIPVGPPPEN
jgi:hypothetical protein